MNLLERIAYLQPKDVFVPAMLAIGLSFLYAHSKEEIKEAYETYKRVTYTAEAKK